MKENRNIPTLVTMLAGTKDKLVYATTIGLKHQKNEVPQLCGWNYTCEQYMQNYVILYNCMYHRGQIKCVQDSYVTHILSPCYNICKGQLWLYPLLPFNKDCGTHCERLW